MNRCFCAFVRVINPVLPSWALASHRAGDLAVASMLLGSLFSFVPAAAFRLSAPEESLEPAGALRCGGRENGEQQLGAVLSKFRVRTEAAPHQISLSPLPLGGRG